MVTEPNSPSTSSRSGSASRTPPPECSPDSPSTSSGQSAPTTRSTAASSVTGANSNAHLSIRASLQNGYNSFNGPVSTAKESSFLGPQEEGKINVGDDFQAEIPDFNPSVALAEYAQDEVSNTRQSMCLWKPPNDPNKFTDEQLIEFINKARRDCNFTAEQALGILDYTSMDIVKASESLMDYRSIPAEWTKTDKLLFEQAFSFNGKAFRRIKQMIPDKSVADLVEYYYSWKKKRPHRNQMAFCEQAFRRRKAAWFENLDEYNMEQKLTDVENSQKPPELQPCSHCRTPCAQLQDSPHGRLCGTCFLFWRRNNHLRKLPSAMKDGSAAKSQKHEQDKGSEPENLRMVAAPEDMSTNVIDFAEVVGYKFVGPPLSQMDTDAQASKREESLRNLEAEITAVRERYQRNKQVAEAAGLTKTVRQEFQENTYNISHLKKDQRQPRNHFTKRWSAYDNLLAIQGFRRYGSDFPAITDVVGSKSHGHVKRFYTGNNDQYKLDDLIKQCDEEKASKSVPHTNGFAMEVIDLDMETSS